MDTNELNQPVGKALPHWRACQVPSREPMQGRFCRLESVQVSAHAQDLSQAFTTDHSNWTYLPYGPFSSEAQFAEWLEQNCLGDDPLFHTIIDVQTSKPVGLASYLRIEPSVGVIETGHIHYSPLMQRTPVATETMYLMMHRVFEELGYRRYEWKCDALNEPSKRAAKRLGFQYEGTFRQATIYKDRNRDTAWFSILDSEWPVLKAAFEKWLQADNFDASGQQRQSLGNLRSCVQ